MGPLRAGQALSRGAACGRLRQHNEGISRWTAGRGPWQILWTRQFPALGPPRRFESLLKRPKGGRGFCGLTELSPERFCRGGSSS